MRLSTTLPKAVAEVTRPQQHSSRRRAQLWLALSNVEGTAGAMLPLSRNCGAEPSLDHTSQTALGKVGFSYSVHQQITLPRAFCAVFSSSYDAENRMVEIKLLNDTLVSTYAFDGHSLRVIKVVGAARTWHVYAGTEIVAEYDDASSATYSAGTNSGSAPSDSVSTVLYQHSDHLTSRLTTENSGQLSNEQAHYPYGESWYAQGAADGSVLKKYTSYMKDAEAATGKLNYAVFREHSGRIGRFHMADPVQSRGTPQRLNRYAYVRNNPANRRDRRGTDDEGNDLVDPCSVWVSVIDCFVSMGMPINQSLLEIDGGVMPDQQGAGTSLSGNIIGGWNGAAEKWHAMQQAPAVAANLIPVGCWDGSGFRDPQCANAQENDGGGVDWIGGIAGGGVGNGWLGQGPRPDPTMPCVSKASRDLTRCAGWTALGCLAAAAVVVAGCSFSGPLFPTCVTAILPRVELVAWQ